MYKLYPSLLDAFDWMKRSDSDDAEREFLAKVNREPSAPTDPMLRGIAFEETLERFRRGEKLDEIVLVHDTEVSREVFEEFRGKLDGAVYQIGLESIVRTPRGPVLVYGKADYIRRDTVIDVKTCGKYEFPKFTHSFQRPAYLNAVEASGINRFRFLVTDFRDVYQEDYGWSEGDRARMVDACVEVIDFLESARGRVTDRKVFGLE